VTSDLLTPLNFPDEIWTRLKTWAKTQASACAEPSLQECATYVRRICGDIAGDQNALRPDVVAFYAREAQSMIERFRTAASTEGGVA
jgi:hypothetical protein